MESSLTGLGFNEELPFEIKMAESQYSNSEGIETEIQLADSGYGQGQVLVNPLHMACIYSAFCNEGNVIKPYLVYQNEATAEYWIPGAFSNETATETTFDLSVKHNDKYVGIEISFQVTTNSTIERKAGQAQARYKAVEESGNYIAYIIDGAGNFQRESALTSICQYSHCTVAYTDAEFDVLIEFIREKIG